MQRGECLYGPSEETQSKNMMDNHSDEVSRNLLTTFREVSIKLDTDNLRWRSEAVK